MKWSVAHLIFFKDELLAELAELEQEELEESMKNMARLPSVPNTKLPSARPSHRASKYIDTHTQNSAKDQSGLLYSHRFI